MLWLVLLAGQLSCLFGVQKQDTRTESKEAPRPQGAPQAAAARAEWLEQRAAELGADAAAQEARAHAAEAAHLAAVDARDQAAWRVAVQQAAVTLGLHDTDAIERSNESPRGAQWTGQGLKGALACFDRRTYNNGNDHGAGLTCVCPASWL